jgi:hypothetical protein
MPQLGVFIGIDSTQDGIIGPPILGVLTTELGVYLRTEDDFYLAFD